MSGSRVLPLFESAAEPSSWNERMVPGEYAVLYSENSKAGVEPVCTVFPGLAEAEAHAAEQVGARPTLRCRIYDHQGFAREPVREIIGAEHRPERLITAGFRRWVGSGLFVVGVVLIFLDWRADFRLSWPAMLGVRMAPAGLLLLVIELAIVLERRLRAGRVGDGVRRAKTGPLPGAKDEDRGKWVGRAFGRKG